MERRKEGTEGIIHCVLKTPQITCDYTVLVFNHRKRDFV